MKEKQFDTPGISPLWHFRDREQIGSCQRWWGERADWRIGRQTFCGGSSHWWPRQREGWTTIQGKFANKNPWQVCQRGRANHSDLPKSEKKRIMALKKQQTDDKWLLYGSAGGILIWNWLASPTWPLFLKSYLYPAAFSSKCIALLVIQHHNLNFCLFHFVSSMGGVCQGGNPI